MKINRSNSSLYILCSIGFATFFSSYLRIPVLPLFASSLGAGTAEVGGINGAFMLTAGLLSIPAGLLADRIGRKLSVVAGLAAIAFSSLIAAKCQATWQLVVAYVIFGVGLSAFAPGMLSLVADVASSGRLGRAYGWYTTAVYVAMTVGPATGGYLARHAGLRQVFVLSGILLSFVSFASLALLPSAPPCQVRSIRLVLADTLCLLRKLPLLACMIATAGSCIGFGVFLTFLPLHAAGLGFDSARTGVVFAAQAMVNVAARIPMGMLADRVDRRLLVSSGLILLATALALIGRSARFDLMLGCALLLGCGMALIFTSIGALVAELAPMGQRGLAMGMYNCSIYLGMMTGATSMGIALKSISYSSAFAAAGAAVLLSMFLFRLLFSAATSRTGSQVL